MPDLSFHFPLILQSALIPFVVALVLLAVSRAGRFTSVGAALAISAGFIGAYFAILHAQWSFFPKAALDWLPWIAAAGVAAAVAAERIETGGLRLGARFAASLALGALVVWPALAGIGMQKALLTAAVTAAVACAVWSMLANAVASRPTPPLLLALVAGGGGIALMLDASLAIGQLSGALASALMACVLVNVPRMRVAFTPAAVGVAVLVLGALLADAYVYAAFPLGYIALLIGGLLADPLVAVVNRLRGQSGGVGSWVAATVLTAVPVAVVVALAAKTAADSGGY